MTIFRPVQISPVMLYVFSLTKTECTTYKKHNDNNNNDNNNNNNNNNNNK